MTIDEKRIKAAIFLKWTDVERATSNGMVCGKPPVGSGYVVGLNSMAWFNLDSDLNAMHEAEKVLDDKQKTEYSTFLFVLQGADLKRMQRDMDEDEQWWYVATATAPQRFEAFGLTLGLWKEGE